MSTTRFALTLIIPALALATSSAHAQLIQLDYTHAGLFFADESARAAVDKAAADLNALLAPTSLGAIPSSPVFEATSGDSLYRVTWGLNYENPSDLSTVTLADPALPANTIRLYVGERDLTAPTLGQAGPGGSAINFNFTPMGGSNAAAAQLMEAESNAVMSRGGGPIITRYQETVGGEIVGGEIVGGETVTLDLGMTVGSLWFDNTLGGGQSWHLDPDTPVTAGAFDLYSVALHEIMHALGAGASFTWNSYASGDTWTLAGSSAVAAAGTTAILAVGASAGHLAQNLTGQVVGTGDLQTVVLAPALSAGERRFVTDIDLGLLQDLGYAVIPEPVSLGLVLCGVSGLLMRRRRSVA